MDDLICHSPTIHKDISRLRQILKLLRNVNLKIQPDKCQFLRKEDAQLAHIIIKDGIKLNTTKVGTINNFPQLKTPK